MASTILQDKIVSLSGTHTLKRSDFTKLLEDHGATVCTSVTKRVNLLISTPDDVARASSSVEKATSYKIAIVKEEWVHDSIKEGKLKELSDYELKVDEKAASDDKGESTSDTPAAAGTSADAAAAAATTAAISASGRPKRAVRTAKKPSAPAEEEEEEDDEDHTTSRSREKKKTAKATTDTTTDSASAWASCAWVAEEKEVKKAKVIVKGRAAVDEHSGLVDSGQVYEEGDDVYAVMLNQTDVAFGTYGHNKFYVIQIIKTSDGKFVVWNRWGRVGVVGQNSRQITNDAGSAKSAFMKKFKDKTSNNWEDRKHFVAKKGKYTLIEIDYSATDDAKPEEKASDTTEPPKKKMKFDSKLDPRLQDLVQLISNISIFTETMREFEIDINRMPLGKLSKAQVKKGYEILKQIQDVLDGKSHDSISGLSSEFYTNIPHDFGRARPPQIRDKELVKNKIQMIEALSDMEIASRLLKESEAAPEHPLDSAYHSLHTAMSPLDKDSKEWKLIEQFVKNGHAPTHTAYKLEVLDIFSLSRNGEAERFKPWKTFHNRRLLWHGSRLTNFMGILSQGLRIAPPEAPATGYMFGKGIYFADLVTKSSNYCWANSSNSIGCMLLSEVALGDMYERLGAEYVTTLPKGKHSTWGKGKNVPDPKMDHITEDGMIIPVGTPTPASDVGKTATLLYNEFIVYDISQVNIKYMLKLKFHFTHSGFW